MPKGFAVVSAGIACGNDCAGLQLQRARLRGGGRRSQRSAQQLKSASLRGLLVARPDIVQQYCLGSILGLLVTQRHRSDWLTLPGCSASSYASQ